MRILATFCLFLLLFAGAASAHGCGRSRCDRDHWRDRSCWRESRRGCCDSGLTAHRRWYRHSHTVCSGWSCGAPHHHHVHQVSCGEGCAVCLKDFPANPRDGQEVWVRGVKYEWDADDHRWEID